MLKRLPVLAMGVLRGRMLWVWAAAAWFVFISLALLAQQPATVADQFTTPERFKKHSWWPTKGTPLRKDYVGNAACAECHASLVASQRQTGMARTSVRATDSAILQAHPLNYQLGPYTYRITHSPEGVVYSVEEGSNKISGPLYWGFGVGKMGQSYLFDYEGKTYMVPLSYYEADKVWDFTVDISHSPPESLQKALGRELTTTERRGCYDCHNTAAITGGEFQPDAAGPGVSCESCHGPGADHVAAAKAGLADHGMSLIMNPRRLSPTDSVDFCGACHRTWWDVVLGDLRGPKSVRFPAYRLQDSRCWGKGDPRITCVACHDPHQPLVTVSSAYDKNCLSCHVLKGGAPQAGHPGAACPVGTKECSSCHMPKSEAAFVHSRFTDHMIRVVRPGEKMPE